MKRYLLAILACVPLLATAGTGAYPLQSLSADELQSRQQADLAAVLRYRSGLRSVIEFAAGQPRLFPAVRASDKRLLSQEERDAVRAVWRRLQDYFVALDSIAALHADYRRLGDERQRAASFLVNQAAFLAQYRSALEFIDVARHEPGLDVLFNEPLPDAGGAPRSFDRFKFRFLNVARATEFAAREVLSRHYGGAADSALADVVREDAGVIARMGRGRGETMTVANAVDVVRKSGFGLWFPVQAGVAEWMGDTKVLRLQRSLITAEQIATLPGRLEPGDILLERREWYVSNVGLPGFWPHAALYIGSPAERESYFDTPEVRDWVRAQGEPSGSFERLLARRHPRAQADGAAEHGGHPARVVEAISEGVAFTTIEHSADADSLAVLRPRVSRVDKAMALLRAYGYAGRPYDFNFDFRSDAALVCSELVFKAYEAEGGRRGLAFPVNEVLGRLATSPNDIVEQFDSQFGSPAQQTDLVLFLDGQERAGRAVDATLEEFRRSWRRPKWHLLTQARVTGQGL